MHIRLVANPNWQDPQRLRVSLTIGNIEVEADSLAECVTKIDKALQERHGRHLGWDAHFRFDSDDPDDRLRAY